MKRKLISYDAFNQIEKSSLTNAAYELSEAESVISRLLGTRSVKLHCLDESNVMYELANGTFVRANYTIKEGKVHLANMEQIVIDEQSLDASMKDTLRNMVEALADKNDASAETHFNKYMEMASPKMKFQLGRRGKGACDTMASNIKGNMGEGFDISIFSKKKDKDGGDDEGNKDDAKAKGKDRKKKAKSAPPWLKAKDDVKKTQKGKKKKLKQADFAEWSGVVNNVLDYVDYMEVAPAISEAAVARNDRGDVVAMSIPVAQVRAEGKILDYKYKGLKTDVKVLREAALLLSNDSEFQKSVADVKKNNNLSDNEGLEESLNSLVSRFPAVLYLTQQELSKVIGEALIALGVSNFDDQTCTFMAEGILRVAFEAYPERANKIVNLSGRSIAEAQDTYQAFQDIVKDFYPSVDESFHMEMRVFEDLRDVFVEVHTAAKEIGWKELCDESVMYIQNLDAVINGTKKPNLTLAEQAAAFLFILAETNLEMDNWDVVKQPYETITGEHPDMAKKAGQGYVPSKDFTGNWGDPAPALDDEGGKYGAAGAKKIRNSSWGNIGGEDTYPSLSNPVVPKAGDYTIKGEKGVDKSTDDGLAQWQSGDTVPGLNNPYVPKSVTKHVNNDNRVDDVQAKL